MKTVSPEYSVLLNGIALRVARFISNPQAPTLLFLHESFGCIRHWRDFPEALARATGCNALVYDRQGYGGSDPFSSLERGNDYLEKEADILQQLLEKLELEKVILFGHSDGGSIALIAASRYPRRITAVITEGAHVFVEEETLRGIREAVVAYRDSSLREKLWRYHAEKTDAVFQVWADTWLSERFRRWNIEHFLPGITCPILVIQGSRDEYGTSRQVEAIVSGTSGPSDRFLPPCGHTPHREAQEETMAAVIRFLSTHPLRSFQGITTRPPSGVSAEERPTLIS